MEVVTGVVCSQSLNSPNNERKLSHLGQASLPSRRDLLRSAALATLGGLAGCCPNPIEHLLSPAELNVTPGFLTLCDGTQVFYELSEPVGIAPGLPTIVASHGFSSDHSEAKAFVPCENFRVLSYDIPGHGQSEPFRTGTHSIERVGEVLDQLVSMAGSGPLILLGFSMGGMITARYAVEHPELEAGVININSSPIPLVWTWAEVYERLLERTNPTMPDLRAQIEFIESMQSFNITDSLTGDNKPWLIFGSTRDVIFPLSAARLFADLLVSQCRFVTLDNEKHNPSFLGMLQIREAILDNLDFLARGSSEQ